MSAVIDGDKPDVIKVLFLLHKGFDLVDFAGPFEVFQNARHSSKENPIKAFECLTAGDGTDGFVVSEQGAKIKVDMDFEDAEEDLNDFDMLVVLGGNSASVLEQSQDAAPLPLIKAYAALQEKDPSRERTLFSVCTGALFLAKAGVLQGLSATTNRNSYTKLEIVSQTAAQDDTGILTDVQEERYVVNNGRFEVVEAENNPFVFKKNNNNNNKSKQQEGAAIKKARRGSEAFKLARRRESAAKRSELPLAGLRVITSGGTTAGMDAALYLVAAHVDIPSAEKIAHDMDFKWHKGLCVEAIDV